MGAEVVVVGGATVERRRSNRDKESRNAAENKQGYRSREGGYKQGI